MQKRIFLFIFLLFNLLLYSNLYAISTPDSLKLLIPKKSKPERIKIYYEISKSYIGTENDSAIKFSNIGILLSNETNNQIYLPDFYQIIGYSSFLKRNYNQSINYYNSALGMFENRKNKNKVADLNAYLGIIYQETYNYNKSIQYFYKSLKLYKELNDSANLSGIYNNIGLLFYRIGNNTKALYYFNESLNIAMKLNLLRSVAYTYNNLSLIYKNSKQYHIALKYLYKSEQILITLKENNNLVITYQNIGEIHLNLKNYAEAERFFYKSLNLSTEINATYLQASIYLSLANLHYVQNYFANTYYYLKLASDLIKKYRDLGIENSINHLFSDYYKAVNDYENALSFLKNYKIINDSIFNQESIENIEKLKIQFETSEIETENELLQQNNIIKDITLKKQHNTRNTYIVSILIIIVLIFIIVYSFLKKRKANLQLQELNNLLSNQRLRLEHANITKDKFLSIIAHDLKNPFYDLKQYAVLLKNNNISDRKLKKEMISDLKTLSCNINNLIENLLNWAESQLKATIINKSELNILDLVNESIQPHLISAEKKEIKTIIEINPEITVFADKYTLNTIIRNLYNNAVKFTSSNGEITIKVEKKDSFTKISIKDNGIGISAENLNNLFKLNINSSVNGTSNEKGSGLGLVICKEFIEMNEGKIYAESELNKGSIFYLEINNSNN